MRNVVPISLERTVSGRRTRNREHLTPDEMEKLLKAARDNRYGCRDHVLLLVTWSHGLRVSEALWTLWPDLDLVRGIFHVRREKGSLSGDHPSAESKSGLSAN